MTTKITIRNEADSNGDVNYRGTCLSSGGPEGVLFPGSEITLWITTSSALFITETWPTKKPVVEQSPPNG
jgi:hypothetical protein